ncbi:MAG TPA: DUF4242 domain-containing protein [Steroidobacteraceae bacterium]|jgi:hypothetical protein|nr:DUF4242 domain-containing protein [Steroidobacteraceae bacterium]
MPRYLVERSFPDGLQIPADEAGARACLAMMECNLQEHVSWLQSYVSVDKRRTYCIYDGPSPEAIRRAANRNKLPIHKITEVSVLEPYFYR